MAARLSIAEAVTPASPFRSMAGSLVGAEPLSRAPGAVPRVRVSTVIATILLTVVILSFRPFQPGGPEGPEAGGDIVNQLGFGSLGAMALLSLLMLADLRVVWAIPSFWLLVLLGLFGLSVMHAADPASAMRAASFTLIGILAVSTVLVLSRDGDGMATVLAISGAVVVGLSYLGLIVFPNEALHSGASMEPQHAGLWRGAFAHKNIAGPVMACFSFAGIYLFRRGWRRRGAILFLLALVFMLNTGSKTTAGLIPLSILIVVLPSLIGMRLLTPILFALAMIGTGLATLGIVFIDPIRDFATAQFPELTYTGRTALWAFSGEMIANRPWTGYGYESFWGTPFVLTMDQPFDRDWDIRGIVHGHNSYLDIAVIMGVPALVAAIFAFLIEPLRDYMRTPMRKENIFLADFFMMVLLFTSMNAFLESFFFRRADPVWLFLVMSVVGLRLTARFPLSARTS